MKTKNLFDDVPIKEVKKKKVSEANIIAKKFIEEYYIPKYVELFDGIQPSVSWGKDVKLMARLIKTYPNIEQFGCETHLNFLTKACEKYFISQDTLALKSCWNLGVFYNNFSKLVILLKHSNEEVIDSIMEGYKLAYWNYKNTKCEDSLISKEEIFSQIYLFIKPLWKQYGGRFSLVRFAEIYFLTIFEHMQDKEYGLNFFISVYAQNYFNKWLESEGKEILMFFPKDIHVIDNDALDKMSSLMFDEEHQLFNKHLAII